MNARKTVCTNTLLTLALLLGASGAGAVTPAECAAIENATERLACFDRAFNPQSANPQSAAEEEAAAPVPAEPARPADTTAAVPIAAPTSPAPTVEPAAPRSKPTPVRTEHGMFDQRDERVVTSTVVELMNRNKQRMVFRLDNDEIWIQNSPRNLPIRVGDSVTIKSGLVGGYILRSESGVSTRVKRIDRQ